MPTVTRKTMKPIAIFCYVWLMLGFFIGTLVLLGPARWLITQMRSRGYQQSIEDWAMLAVMGTFVVGSALLARWIVRRTALCQTRRVRVAVPMALTVAAAVCLWGWTSPARLAGAAVETTRVDLLSGAEFVFGPYPEQPRLAQLKEQGFTAVISLQHPGVVPFEPLAIARERAATGELGLEFIHAPMLPWVTANDESLNKVRTIARTRMGRFYVHCGLGRDRVNFVKRMLELEGTRVATGEGYQAPKTLAVRVSEGRHFMRGTIREVEKDVWLLPYPHKNEMTMGNMLAGQIKHVTLVLDPNDPVQRRWIAEAGRLFKRHAIAFELSPLRADDAHRADAIVQAVRKAPRPAAVIVPFTDPQPTSIDPQPTTEVATALLNAFKNQRSLF